MKKLLFFLVFVPSLFAQIKVIGDTTDLKTYNSSGVVILEQYGGSVWDMTGGGLFHYLDSSMTEGTDAFDHPVSGKQWVRVGSSTSPFQNISATTLDVSGDITLENDETIDNSTDGTISFGSAILSTNGSITGAALTGSGTIILKTGSGGSAADSSVVINGSSGSPRVNFYGTDGDLYYLGINTSDRALFGGASGGYLFDTTVTIYTGSGGSATDSSVIIGSTSGAPSIQFFGTDGDAYTIGINTSDAALFAGAGGGYDFTGTVIVDSLANSGGLTVTGKSTFSALDFFKMPLHTKVVGDSALGKVFLDAADTVMKAGTGTDLVVIKDLAP